MTPRVCKVNNAHAGCKGSKTTSQISSRSLWRATRSSDGSRGQQRLRLTGHANACFPKTHLKSCSQQDGIKAPCVPGTSKFPTAACAGPQKRSITFVILAYYIGSYRFVGFPAKKLSLHEGFRHVLARPRALEHVQMVTANICAHTAEVCCTMQTKKWRASGR